MRNVCKGQDDAIVRNAVFAAKIQKKICTCLHPLSHSVAESTLPTIILSLDRKLKREEYNLQKPLTSSDCDLFRPCGD